MPQVIVFSGTPYRSISFNGSDQFLSMAASTYNHSDTKISVSIWFKQNTNSSAIGIYSHDDGLANRTFHIAVGNIVRVSSFHSGSTQNLVEGNTSLSTGMWYHLLVHIDPTNSTSSNRIKVWINGSAETFSTSVLSQNTIMTGATSGFVNIGTRYSNGTSPTAPFDGLIYQPSLFSGTLVDIGDVYSSGPIRDISGVTGLHSLLQHNIRTSTSVVDDAILATDWTNHNTVALATEIPQ